MKQNRFTVIVIICIFFCLFFGCNYNDDGNNTSVADLTAMKWQLKYFGSVSDNESVLDNTRITALFDEEGAVEGSSGCNTYFSDYVVDADGSLSFSAIAVTEMYCESPDGVMDQENKYLNALSDVRRFKILANTLKLFYGDSGEFLFFMQSECVTNDDCLAGSYCKKTAADCESLGICTYIPDVCDQSYQPVCGCDVNTYSNMCVAASNGVNVLKDENCDDAVCADSECGPAPGMPNYPCFDGTIGGPTGRCLSNTNGTCGWEIRNCPEA